MQVKISEPAAGAAALNVEQSYLRTVVERLSFARPFGTPDNIVAQALVAREFDRILGSCYLIGDTGNVCCGNPRTARILIGAHYDSVPNSPGADDNASAVAVMAAVAQVIGPQPGIMYVAFNAEEDGLVGSREFLAQMHGRMSALETVHVLEMVGYTDSSPGSQQNPLPLLAIPTKGDFLGIVANDAELVDQIMAHAGGVSIPVVGLSLPKGMPLSAIREVSPHFLRSDHVWFWERNIAAAMWTDTSEFRNPHYHKPEDVPQTLDYGFMAQVSELLISAVRASLS